MPYAEENAVFGVCVGPQSSGESQLEQGSCLLGTELKQSQIRGKIHGVRILLEFTSEHHREIPPPRRLVHTKA